VRHRLAVRAVGGQRLEDVRHRQDPGRAREVEGRQPAVVARAVEPLVVVGGRLDDPAEARHAVEDRVRVARVLADRRHLVVVEPAGLVEDPARHRELAALVRMAWPGGSPSVMSSAYESAPSTSERATRVVTSVASADRWRF
jgi:hypothetical protein